MDIILALINQETAAGKWVGVVNKEGKILANGNIHKMVNKDNVLCSLPQNEEQAMDVTNALIGSGQLSMLVSEWYITDSQATLAAKHGVTLIHCG